MTFKVEYTGTARKQLKKMDRKITAFILTFIEEKLVGCENPRLYGKALHGSLGDKWRYRIGDYRILAKIEDDKVIILVLEVGHQREINK